MDFINQVRLPDGEFHTKLIAICGHAGSGKSTLARALGAHGYRRMRFAETIKDMCRVVGLSEAEIDGDLKEVPSALLMGGTSRELQRLLGTEIGRRFSADLWVHLWEIKYGALGASALVVVDDVRFPNELRSIRQHGGVVIKVTRPGVVATTDHVSESYVDEIDPDMEFHNNAGVDDVVGGVPRMLESLRGF